MEKEKNKLIKFYKNYRRMPSYAELMNLFGYKSKNAAYKLASKFIEMGMIEKDDTGKLIPKRNFFGGAKILGSVQAGFPSPAEEELADTMTLDEFLIENRDATYILKVTGDSMKDAGILEGDMVIVDRSEKPSEGDIVVAEVDGQWTMKYYRKKNNKVYLQAANKKYKDIFPENELKIAAIVKSVIRKY